MAGKYTGDSARCTHRARPWLQGSALTLYQLELRFFLSEEEFFELLPTEEKEILSTSAPARLRELLSLDNPLLGDLELSCGQRVEDG